MQEASLCLNLLVALRLEPELYLLYSMVEKVQEVVKEAIDIEDAHRLGVQAQLLPGHHLQQLFQRAKAPWNAYKGICLRRHLRLQVWRHLKASP